MNEKENHHLDLIVKRLELCKIIKKSENELNLKDFKQIVNENKQQDETLTPEYYLDDFYEINFNEETYDEEESLIKIQETIDYVLNIKYPLEIYRGINTINSDEDFDGSSWTTDFRIAEGFGNKIYVGFISGVGMIDVEQTIRTRIMNPFEYEIHVPNFKDVRITKTYEK